MKKNSFFSSLPFKLIVALALGIVIGLILNATDGAPATHAILNIVVTVKFIASQFISFCVPLIIIGFIAPSITRLGKNASVMLVVALCLAYASSVLAALTATAAGFTILPHLAISPEVDGLKELPPLVFELAIPQIMPVMSALFFSILVGLAAAWNQAKTVTNVLEEFQQIVLSIVTKFVIPVLPILIGTTFITLAYEGSITKQLPSDLPDHHRDRAGRALYLACTAVRHCRRLFRKEPDGCSEKLRTGLSDCDRNHVQRRDAFRCA